MLEVNQIETFNIVDTIKWDHKIYEYWYSKAPWLERKKRVINRIERKRFYLNFIKKIKRIRGISK